VLDRRHKAVRAIWQNMSRHQRRQLNRAAIDANDQSEPSSRDRVISQSAPRSQRGRGGVRESAAAVASRGFRLLKIPSGGISRFKPLQRYKRCAAGVTRTFSERYMVPV
jgi:hypothetical protein